MKIDEVKSLTQKQISLKEKDNAEQRKKNEEITRKNSQDKESYINYILDRLNNVQETRWYHFFKDVSRFKRLVKSYKKQIIRAANNGQNYIEVHEGPMYGGKLEREILIRYFESEGYNCYHWQTTEYMDHPNKCAVKITW